MLPGENLIPTPVSSVTDEGAAPPKGSIVLASVSFMIAVVASARTAYSPGSRVLT